MRDALAKIAIEYRAAAEQPFAKHPIAEFIRHEAVDVLEHSIGHVASRFKCKGSAGNGNFADVPWLAVFDELVTQTATKGYYVVFLFGVDGHVHLSLNQGATAVRQEFKRLAPAVLADRATLIRARLPEFVHLLPTTTIKLYSEGQLPKDYERGHALGCSYTPDNLPGENELVADFQNCLAAYMALTYRGGLEPSLEWAPEQDELGLAASDLFEIRKYRLHRKIERNHRLAGLAKVLLGCRCQVCGFDFSETYGAIGDGFIEAHHLQPISRLEEGRPIALDPIRDFAVLCSNCHRMVHKQDDPSDLAALKASIELRRDPNRS